MAPGARTCSVVVPVYNGEQTLPELVRQLVEILPSLAASYEIILVNDGSRDHSWEVICRLSQDRAGVRGINLMRNYGQHNALLCGIRAAQHDVIITMDDDLQHPPAEIPKLLGKLAEGYDVVYGSPQEEQHGFWRDLASLISKLVLQNAMGAKTARRITAFRAFRSHLREAFTHYQSPFVSVDVLLTWGTSRFCAIAVRHDLRRAGRSNYTFRTLVTHAFNMMTGFSAVPLQLASWIGFACAFFGIGVLLYVVGRRVIQGSHVPGFPFLASVIAIFSGAQLFTLGVIGEYLARMHFRMMDRPAYVVHQQIGSPRRSA